MAANSKSVLKPCFSCADKNFLIKDLQAQIGKYKKKIDELEGTWFSPARVKEIQKKLHRSEHCRDALISESRAQRSLIKEQSEALHKVYIQAAATRKIVKIPIGEADNLFPAHHDTAAKSSPPSKKRCRPCVETQLSPERLEEVLVGNSRVPPNVASTSAAAPNNSSTNKPKRRQLSRAERKRKQRERVAAKQSQQLPDLGSNVNKVPAVIDLTTGTPGRIISAAGVTWEENASEFFDLDELLADSEWEK